MPRFVILLHETPPGSARATHYDVMFEHGDVLRTWAVEQAPSLGCDLPAQALADHRLAYLDYEGLVSNDRGEVHRFDQGEYLMVEDSADRFAVRINGRKLHGTLVLSLHPQAHCRLQIGP